jgi:hypothetical protein
MGVSSAPVMDSLRRHWKKFLAVLGVSGALDILKDYFRGKLMDWAASKLGPFGRWLMENPAGLFTLAVALLLAFILAVTIRESSSPPRKSHILDHEEKPFARQLSKRPVAITACVIFLVIVIVVYGTWTYYRPKPMVVLPPTALQEAAVSESRPVSRRAGKVVKLPKAVWPCSNGKKPDWGWTA